MRKELRNWLRYEKVRRGGLYNMIMGAYSASQDAGLSMDEYVDVMNHFTELRHEIEEHLTEEQIDRFTANDKFSNKFKYSVKIVLNSGMTIEFDTNDITPTNMNVVLDGKQMDGDTVVEGTVLDLKNFDKLVLTSDGDWEFVTEEEAEEH